MPDFNTIWPVITFTLGGLAVLGRDLLRERRQDRRERNARLDADLSALQLRRELFELETLEKLTVQIEAVHGSLTHCVLRRRANGSTDRPFPRLTLDDPLRTKFDEEYREARRLRGLLLDDTLMESVSRALQHAYDAYSAKGGLSNEGIDELVRTASHRLGYAQGRIAAHIRTLYNQRSAADDQATPSMSRTTS